MLARATIAAVASGRPPSAIAILRVSGPQAFALGRTLCGTLPVARTAALRAVRRVDGTVIDRALALAFPAPASATGEDVIEIHLHGGQAVIAAALAAALAFPGVRLAEPGEFTRRAFDHGRLDLTQVEGLADLLAATTEAQRALALGASDGAMTRRAAAWRAALLDELVKVEASLDFSDEADVTMSPQGPALREALNEMRALLARTLAAERIRDGLSVVLVGPPNAGKSSLLNAIIGRDAAIVAPSPGTTRDLIEVELDLDGVLVRLIDTAGLRDSSDPVEAEGISRAKARAARADLVLELGASNGRSWHVHNRIDLTGERGGERDGTSYVSAVTGEGIPALLDRLTTWAHGHVPDGEAAAICHARQAAAVLEAADRIAEAIGERDATLSAESLRLGLRALGRLTGTVDVEDVLGGIFSRFCIGK